MAEDKYSADAKLRHLMTRLPEGLRSRLEHAAKANRRSMNSELIRRLEESFLVTDIASAVVQAIDRRLPLGVYAQQYATLQGHQLFSPLLGARMNG